MSCSRWLPPLALLALLWAVIAVAAGDATGPSGDLIAERGYLRDPGGTLDIHSVARQTFTPLRGALGLGNAGIPTWLRLVVPPQPAQRAPLMLVLQPAVLEAVQLYLPATDGGGWTRVDTGSHVAYVDRHQRSLNFSHPFPARTDAPTVLYVRIQTHTGVTHAQVLTLDEAQDFDTRAHVGMGLYLGFALVMAMLSASLWASTGKALWGLAALFDLTTIAHVSMTMGLIAKYVLPEASDGMPALMYLTSCTHLVVAGLLWSQLVRMLELPRWVSWAYLSVVPFYALWVPMILGGHGAAVLGQVNIGVMALTLLGYPALFLVRTPDPILRWLYRTLTAILCVYMLYFMLPILNASASSQISLYPALPSNLVTMTMVMAILARRTVLDMRMRQQLEREKLETEQRYRLEQQHHAETSGMLGMIMHEMKNPLASIRVASELLSTGRVRTLEEQEKRFRNIQDAVDGIDTVLQRCIDVDRLDKGAFAEERHPEDVALLLRQWLAQHRGRKRIDADLPESLEATLDARLLLLMLGNLVDNALKYSPPDSRVALRLAADGALVRIEVANREGRAGRPDPQRLFQKYYRSPTAQHGGGTGLGLYWVQTVATQIGGAVTYRDQPDALVFTLTLPA